MDHIRVIAYETVLRACSFGSLAIFCVMVGMSFNARAAFQAGGFLTMLMTLVLVYKAWEARTKNHRRTELWLYLPKEQRPPEGHAQWAVATAMRETYLDLRALDIADRHRDVGAGADVLASRPLARRAITHQKKVLRDNLDIVSGQAQNFRACRKSPNRARQTPIRRGRHVMSISKRQFTTPADSLTPVAGNGLLDRRALLGRGIMLAGAAAAGVGTSVTGAAAEPLKDDPWSLVMGEPTPPRQAAVAVREERRADAEQSQ